MGEKHGARRIKQQSQYLPSSHFKHCPPIFKKIFKEGSSRGRGKVLSRLHTQLGARRGARSHDPKIMT